MKKKILVLSSITIIVIILVGFLIIEFNDFSKTEKLPISYVQTNKELKNLMSEHNISMSSPLKLSGDAIDQYCTFFASSSLQNSIEYCTSTELLDSEGRYLGNIHMVGTPENPQFVIGVIQVSPLLNNLDETKIIFQILIQSLVCTCWEEEKPGGFESVSAWIDTANLHHLGAKKTTSKSEISGLAQKDLLLEITTNTEGYLWKFIIPN